MSSPLPNTGVIHDIGYQHYEGPRLGRGYAMRSLYVHSVRSAYGLGRSAWAKLLPFAVLGFASLTALILVVVNTQLPEPVIDYVGIASTFTYAATVFVAVVAPELVSVDLRSNLLQLYLSRPLRRRDYALTKLASLATATFALFAIPMLIMFLGMAFNTDSGIGGVFDELGGLLQGLVAGAVHAALLSALGLPLASLSGRRVFASGMIIAVFLLTTPISGALQAFGSGALADLGGLLDPSSLLNGVDQWIFGPGIGIVQTGSFGPVYALVTAALIALGTALLVLRYKKVKS
ncbi:ABC transporter permease [Actinophytocola oryzae]|uniref:ABC-2 type transport system permease protein n=1 Tax=Actinophytocola oryzae TaxID=502181 RepID=A0A4R7VX44_9PSEU|nr:ABC transporter permease [Actinophytocola oryzae]TDV53787.1 ABC-2 type transport system permease protein [Actinophytocola oryzae]